MFAISYAITVLFKRFAHASADVRVCVCVCGVGNVQACVCDGHVNVCGIVPLCLAFMSAIR